MGKGAGSSWLLEYQGSRHDKGTGVFIHRFRGPVRQPPLAMCLGYMGKNPLTGCLVRLALIALSVSVEGKKKKKKSHSCVYQ